MADLSALVAEIENGSANALADATQALVNESNLRAPIGETGTLSTSGQVTSLPSPGQFMSSSAENPTDYAEFVDSGTSAHIIDGQPLLAFNVGGARVIVRSVNHPGTAPQPFWSDTFSDSNFADQLQASLDLYLQ